MRDIPIQRIRIRAKPTFTKTELLPELRPVHGACNYYVSPCGKIFSYKVFASNIHGGYYELHPGAGKSGYKSVRVRFDDGIIRTRYLHHLVAASWLGVMPPGTQCIRHLDGNNQNNASNNLAYGTHSQNNIDKLAHGTSPDGERNPMAKLTSREVSRIREMLCDSVDRKLIMKAFNISPMTVSRIARNQAWRNA